MLELNTHWFFGSSPDFVLIVAGIHANEQSGVEVANWIRVKLAKRAKPTRLGAIVIPEVFPERGIGARAEEWGTGKAPSDKWREFTVKGKTNYPSRHFPPPGNALHTLGSKKQLIVNGEKETMFPEIEYVIRVIETIKPVRIVSAHGKLARTRDHLTTAAGLDPKHPKFKVIAMTSDEIKAWDEVTPIYGVNFPGIFVDPRYKLGRKCQTGTDVERCKFNPKVDPAFPLESSQPHFDSAVTALGRIDDKLALAAAKAVFGINNTLVRGNHVGGSSPEVVHYSKELNTPEAYSLGDWGPVTVGTKGDPDYRPGAPVFTIETKDNHESWAFIDGFQVMTEDGNVIKQQPSVRKAFLQRGQPLTKPPNFNQTRSLELQAYAQGIIETILELP